MKKLGILLAVCLMLPFAGNAFEPIPDSTHDYLVTISTEYGDMKVILYDDTPLHKNNFVKLAKAGVYDHIIFHRVIDNFMIQAGDYTTSNKERDYDKKVISQSIPAEFRDQHKHVYGALGAARRGDDENPKKRSSGTQFYIIENPKGAPHLDGTYTVFGQLMSGFRVLHKIAGVKTDRRDKPRKNIRFTMEVEKVKRENIEKFYNYSYPTDEK
jgi:peptidyl-prolyl cis-trans isomerase B (cyclophilin B)